MKYVLKTIKYDFQNLNKSQKDKIAVCVVGDFKFLYKYFNRFIDELRINGNYQGEVLILTDYFTPTFIFPKILFDSKVKVRRFNRIKFSPKAKQSFRNLNTNNQPNRFIKQTIPMA